MNIKPASLCTLNTKNRDISNPINRSVLKSYLSILPHDTVAFGNIGTEVNKLSKQVYDSVLKGNYSYARGLLKNKAAADFNPNFFCKNAIGQNISLMGILIDKVGNMKQYSAKTADAILLFATVLYHPDFELNNKEAEQDLFIKAIENNIPAPMLNMICHSEAFFYMPIENRFKQYQIILNQNGYKDIAHMISQKLDAYSTMVEQANKLDIGLEEYETVDLDNYKVDLLPTDPKNLNELGGMFEVKKDVEEYIIRPWNEKYRKKIEKNGINRPNGILLSGNSGCGKTYLAKAIAGETGYDLYCINLSNENPSCAYEIPKIFDAIEGKYRITGRPSIVFLDGIESIALLKSINNSAQKGIILIGSTNHYDAIDKAVTHSGKFDTVIKIDYPNEREREDIIGKILQNKDATKEVIQYKNEFAKATDRMSPADISSILNKMLLRAIYEDRDFAVKEDFYKELEVAKRKNNMSGITPVGFKNVK